MIGFSDGGGKRRLRSPRQGILGAVSGGTPLVLADSRGGGLADVSGFSEVEMRGVG